jgi:hypothetical protein
MRLTSCILVASIWVGSVAWGEQPPPPARVGIAALVRTFAENEARADEQFTGKAVEVTGTVDRVSRSKYPGVKTGDNEYMLELSPSTSGFQVLFIFAPEHRKALAELAVGQEVTVRGTCGGRAVWQATPGSGKSDHSEVVFRDCQLVKAEKK